MTPSAHARLLQRMLLLASTLAAAPGCASDGGPAGPMDTHAPDGAVPGTDIPCDVAQVVATECLSCHGDTPAGGASLSLTSQAAFAAPEGDTTTVADVALARMRDAENPMPPSGMLDEATIAVFEAWVSADTPVDECATGFEDPYDTPTVCSSGKTWTGGNEESPSMRPGHACISCHTREGEGPRFTFAGTVFPTAHEPNDCKGYGGGDAVLVIVDADGAEHEIRITNGSGNFGVSLSVPLPYAAKLRYDGRERAMKTAQTSGDCNSCHTEDGDDDAPGRVMLP